MSKKKLTKEEKRKLKKIKPGRLTKRDARMGLLFISPWILGALVFLLYPLISSFWYALNNIRMTPLGTNYTFVGQGNFTQILLSDAEFPTQLINYVVSTVISVPIIVVFALLISIMLNQPIKGKGFFRLIFFLPVIIVSGPILGMLNAEGAGSITALDTQAITDAISGFLPAALAKPISSIFENMITILWYSGVQILIFLSALQKIDPSQYEAAKIDGAYIVNLQGDQHKNVTWSFRYVDPDKAASVTEEGEANAFMFESNVYSDSPETSVNGNVPLGNVHGLENAIAPKYAAWLKMQNGCLVLTRGDSDFNSSKTGGDAALVFNVDPEASKGDMVTSNDEVAVEGVSVVAGNGTVTVQGAAGKSVVITNILGKVVAETVLTSDNATIAVPAGIVAVAVEGEEAVKTIVK